MSINFDTYDGYILSPDAKKAIVILESAFGAHESEHNASLAAMLEDAVSMTEKKENSNLDIHVIGDLYHSCGKRSPHQKRQHHCNQHRRHTYIAAPHIRVP